MTTPKKIHGRGKEPNHKKLVRVTFNTPYPNRSGVILSRIPNIVVGQEVIIDGNPDTYVITSCKVVNTPVFGVVSEYTFAASAATVERWTNRLALEEKKLTLLSKLRASNGLL